MIELSSTADRMLQTLPAYYHGNDWVRRVLNGWAAEIDRQDAMLDSLKDGLVPVLADDTLGMLAIWERIFRVPINPPGRSVADRQQTLKVALLALEAFTAADVLALLDAQGVGYTITRDNPGPLQDTLSISADEGGYQAVLLQRIARQAWPAHREIALAFTGGFTLDLSTLDDTEM